MPLDSIQLQMLLEAFAAWGYSGADLDSYLRSCDPEGPVEKVVLPIDSVFVIYMEFESGRHKFATTADEDPKRLAIDMTTRYRAEFTVQNPITVVRCIAADFPNDKIPGIGGSGGGIQYILPPGWPANVARTA